MKSNEISDKTQKRLEKIIEVAFDMFLKKGYANTSLNDIVTKSGGSLSTIYNYFHNKEGLFKAILEKGVKNFFAQIDKKIDINQSLSIEEFLYHFSDVYLDTVLNDRAISFYKLVFGENGTKDTNLKKILYEYESKSINKILYDFFKKDKNIYKFIDSDLQTVAMSFWISVREPFFYKKLLLMKKSISLKNKKMNI